MKLRRRRMVTILIGAALLGSLMVIPAIGQSPVVVERMLHLQLNANHDRFILDPNGSADVQSLGVSGCRITSDESLVKIVGSTTQSNKDPYAGMKDHRIGVGQRGEGNGEPCARINKDLGQSLTLELTGALDGAAIDWAEIDLGFKFNGEARVDLYLDGVLVTPNGLPVPCSGGSDCGPDSGASDNERLVLYTDQAEYAAMIAGKTVTWVAVQAPSEFDKIVFTPATPSNGSISLEGGFDGSSPGPLGIDLNVSDTLFRTVEVFDGELGCDEGNNTDTVSGGTVSGSFTRLDNRDGSECILKPYKLEVQASNAGDTIFFGPEDAPGAEPQLAAYEASLTFAPETSTNPVSTGTLEYDGEDDGTFKVMPWCLKDPYMTVNLEGGGTGTTIDVTAIPSGDTWCIVSETTAIYSTTQTQTTWEAVGIGDPKFR